jgi:hypothetical protein
MKNNSLVTVKNNREGRQFIRTFRKYLRNTPKTIRVFGRGPRHGVETYRNTLPQAKAQRLAVYLNDRPKTRMVYVAVKKLVPGPYVETTVHEWRKVSTKWADKPATSAPAFGHPDL